MIDTSRPNDSVSQPGTQLFKGDDLLVTLKGFSCRKEPYKSQVVPENVLVTVATLNKIGYSPSDIARHQELFRRPTHPEIHVSSNERMLEWTPDKPKPREPPEQGKNVEKPQVQSPPNDDELDLLKDPRLLHRIDYELGKFVVGEEQARQAIFLVSCGRLVVNASPSSYNLTINSESGAGKDHTAKNVLKIWPQACVLQRSRISPTVFNYWHRSDKEPNWTWDGKVCLLMDISNQVLNSDVFKVMCSDGSFATIVVEQKAVDLEIKGKPVMILTTASANPNSEMIRRFSSINLTESQQQTKNIMCQQAEDASKSIVSGTDKSINNVKSAISKLEPVKVVIPYAKELPDVYPSEHIIMRTNFKRFLDYIKASAALHQFQREKDEQGWVIATWDDYDVATIPLGATTSNRFMIPVSKTQKKLLEAIQSIEGKFSVAMLEPKVPFIGKSQLYEQLAKLQTIGYLKSEQYEDGDKKKLVRYYTLCDLGNFSIPRSNELRCRKTGMSGTGGTTGTNGMTGIDPNNSHKIDPDSGHSGNSGLKLPLTPPVITPPMSPKKILTGDLNPYTSTEKLTIEANPDRAKTEHMDAIHPLNQIKGWFVDKQSLSLDELRKMAFVAEPEISLDALMGYLNVLRQKGHIAEYRRDVWDALGGLQ